MNDTKRVIGRPFQPGQSGNPDGRPIGSRQRISEMILRDAAETWPIYGKAVFERLAVSHPDKYAALMVGLVPREALLSVVAKLPGNLEPEDWSIVCEVISAVKASIPDAGDRPPGEVMEHVLTALRAHEAPLIEADEATVQKTVASTSGSSSD